MRICFSHSTGNSKYIGWLVVAVLLLVCFVIGLPLFILTFLLRNRWHVENDPNFAHAMGPLFEVKSRLAGCVMCNQGFPWCFCAALSCRSFLHGARCTAPTNNHRRTGCRIGTFSTFSNRSSRFTLELLQVLSPHWKYSSFALVSMMFVLAHFVMKPFRSEVHSTFLLE
jgi:hypothetical protein